MKDRLCLFSCQLTSVRWILWKIMRMDVVKPRKIRSVICENFKCCCWCCCCSFFLYCFCRALKLQYGLIQVLILILFLNYYLKPVHIYSLLLRVSNSYIIKTFIVILCFENKLFLLFDDTSKRNYISRLCAM